MSNQIYSRLTTHDMIINYVKSINKTTKVFHLRRRPGDLLNEQILRSTPMFWYMKYQWTRQQIEVMFYEARIEMDSQFDASLQLVFGGTPGQKWRGGGKAKRISKDNVTKAINDYNSQITNKSIDYKTFSDNVSPSFDKLTGPSVKINRHEMDSELNAQEIDKQESISPKSTSLSEFELSEFEKKENDLVLFGFDDNSGDEGIWFSIDKEYETESSTDTESVDEFTNYEYEYNQNGDKITIKGIKSKEENNQLTMECDRNSTPLRSVIDQTDIPSQFNRRRLIVNTSNGNTFMMKALHLGTLIEEEEKENEQPEDNINNKCNDEDKVDHNWPMKYAHNANHDTNDTREQDENGDDLPIFRIMEVDIMRPLRGFGCALNGCYTENIFEIETSSDSENDSDIAFEMMRQMEISVDCDDMLSIDTDDDECY